MSNEMKLLTALCDALGFDVERVCVNQDEVDAYSDKIGTIEAYNPAHGILAMIPVHPIYEYNLAKRDEVSS